MKIALAQLNYTIADIEGNVNKINQSIQKAISEEAKLIIFSELAICGYPPDDLLDYPHFVQSCIDALHSIASQTFGITAIIGCPSFNTETKGRKLRNSAFVVCDGKVVNIIHKTLLPTYDVFNESRYFESNTDFKEIQIGDSSFVISICEDLWHEMDAFSYKTNPIAEYNSIKSAPRFIINLSASPYFLGKREDRFEILKKTCLESNMGLIYVNQVGAHTDLIFDGHSMALNERGEICCELSAFKEEIAYFDTSNIQIKEVSKQRENIADLHESLVFGLKDYFTKMGFKTAVLGSSGGIDSAVVQALASEAIGGENVHAILMPSDFSSEGSVLDAETLSKNYNNPYSILPISDIYNSYIETLSPIFKDLAFNTAEENIQARSRAVLLMGISNKMGNILLNTSNKSEMSVGYTTLYGDMCGSLSVIGDLYKTTVYELAKYINRNSELIPNNIIFKAPSAELRPNQKDSDSLPDYSILDGILKHYIEGQKSIEDIVSHGYEATVVKRVVRMVNNNEYKRFQAPPILKMSSKAFGRGRVIPLVSKW